MCGGGGTPHVGGYCLGKTPQRRRFFFDIFSQLTSGTVRMTNATTLKEESSFQSVDTNENENNDTDNDHSIMSPEEMKKSISFHSKELGEDQKRLKEDQNLKVNQAKYSQVRC